MSALNHPILPTENLNRIFCHPDRKHMRTRPFKALCHFRKLIANKEDTSQVFHIFESFPRKAALSEARAFVESDAGKRIMASEPYLPDLLDDHDSLKKLPGGSVGRTYVEFMEREGLSAAGLVAEHESIFVGRPQYNDMVEWYFNRGRDTHDLLHILSGYGRDALGEQCVLAFTHGQNPHFANLFIAYAGGFELKRKVKKGAPVFTAIREAQRNGKKMPNLVEMNIAALLGENLEAARKRLNIAEPHDYRRTHEHYRKAGIDPYDFLAPVAV